jgi:hypothetical protein
VGFPAAERRCAVWLQTSSAWHGPAHSRGHCP